MQKLLLIVLPILLVVSLAVFSIQTSAFWQKNKNRVFVYQRLQATMSPKPSLTPTPSPKPTVVAKTTKAVPKPTTIPTTGLNFAGKQSWGAYVGWSPEEGVDFENQVGKKMDNRATFVHWGNENEFPDYLAPGLKANNQTITIFWEAMDYNGPTTDQPKFSYSAILRGDFDSYITSFAAQVKNYGGPVILIPFEEMNGDWYPWSANKNGNTIDQEIQAYRYVHKFFAGVPNVKFAWDINCTSEPQTADNRIELYYPGDQYVDVVGVNGFNTGNPNQSFDQIFGTPLKTLKSYNKPIYVFSMATVQGDQKPAWIKDALTVQIPKHPEIAGWVWFNENKERDWRVWSDQSSLDAFKSATQLY